MSATYTLQRISIKRYKPLNENTVRNFIYIFLFLFSILQLSAGSLYAQTSSITGTVFTNDNKPAAAVTVHLSGTKKYVLTNDDGIFRLNNINPGNYTIEVSLIGYETVKENVSVQAGRVSSVSIKLSVNAASLSEVAVSGNRQRYTTHKASNSLRLQTPLIEVPQNIQVVTGKALSDQQVFTLADGLARNVSGVNTLDQYGGGLFTNFSMRGSQIKAFRNGFGVDNSYLDVFTEDMSIVDHVEFVKGPAGFMLANGDPAGMYNVVTKKPTGETKGEANFTMGSYDLYRASLDLDGKLDSSGKLLYRLNLAGQRKNSFRPNEFSNRYTVAPVISYQVDNKTKLTAEYTWQNTNTSDIFASNLYSPDGYATLPRNTTILPAGLPATKINEHSFYLIGNHQLNDNWKLTAQLAYFNYNLTGTALYPEDINADGSMIRSLYIFDTKGKMTMGQVFVNGNISTGKINHRILVGFDGATKSFFSDYGGQTYNLDTVGGEFNPKGLAYGLPAVIPQFDRSLDLETRALQSGDYGVSKQRYSSLYLQDEIAFFEDKLRLTLAGRYTYLAQPTLDGESHDTKHFTSRAGLSYSITPNVAIYALYDQAFTPQQGILVSGARAKPITGNNMEVGVKKDWFGGNWNTTLSVYRILKNNEITSVPNTNFSQVIGQKRAQGIEFDLKGTILPGFNVIANYAYTDATVTKVNSGIDASVAYVGERVTGSNKHTMNTWLSYKMQTGSLKGVGISGGFTYLADRATSFYSKTEPNENLPAYFKLDGGLFYESNKIRLTLNVFNILDTYLYSGSYATWYTAPAYTWQAEPGRNWRLGISYSF